MSDPLPEVLKLLDRVIMRPWGGCLSSCEFPVSRPIPPIWNLAGRLLNGVCRSLRTLALLARGRSKPAAILSSSRTTGTAFRMV